ncbi:hypothetical protein ETB55_21730 [Salmonella enterica subsp. enterica serovar Omuna]|nr:hypothetical protein [Salmonella enterica subsp. enterica serovar Omuna]
MTESRDEMDLNFLLSQKYTPGLVNVDADIIVIDAIETHTNLQLNVKYYDCIGEVIYGHIIDGENDGKLICVSLCYNKYFVDSHTGDPIHGIKSYLRKHSIKKK